MVRSTHPLFFKGFRCSIPSCEAYNVVFSEKFVQPRRKRCRVCEATRLLAGGRKARKALGKRAWSHLAGLAPHGKPPTGALQSPHVRSWVACLGRRIAGLAESWVGICNAKPDRPMSATQGSGSISAFQPSNPPMRLPSPHITAQEKLPQANRP